jgi:hypothetical protein
VFGQIKKKPGRPKGQSKPLALAKSVPVAAPVLNCSFKDFILKTVDRFWREPATLRLPTVIFQNGYLEISDSFN